MKHKQLILGVSAVTVLLGAGGVSAAIEGEFMERGQRHEVRQEVRELIDAGDYDAFVDAMADHEKILEKIDEEKFYTLGEIHELMQNGQYEEAKALAEESGIDRKWKKMKKRHERRAVKAEARAAIEAEDYDAFLAAHEGHDKVLDIIDSEEDFGQLIEAHELRESGDKEGAREIMERLGFERPEHKKHRRGLRQ